MQKDSAMRLLIVDDRVEDAEAIVSALRNGGIAVRPLRPQNTAELEHMVASQPVDLVLAAASVAMPLEQVQARVAASGKDLPLLLLVDRIEEAAVLGMAEAGLMPCGTSWIGTFAFALAVQVTGSQRIAIVALIIFFVIGLLLLSRVDVRRAIVESGNDPSGVVL